ncbi:MAG: amidohydrolase [Deltaproteobacteria bacterium]|nr:amidohydrolase [Deltaproteobacteria bacterium]
MSHENPVIDMQHHFIPAEALKLVKKTEEHDFTYGLNRFKKEYEQMVNVDEHLRWMDDSGIDMAILSTSSFSPNGFEFCKACNDGYSEVTKSYPARFKGMVHFYPFADESKNRDEIKRGVEELGLWGIATVTSFQNMTIDSPLMDPAFELAVKYDMPVFVHPSIRMKLWGGERYDLFMTVSREYEIVKSFVELVYGVLPRFPKLKIIMAHFAGGLPILKGRLLAWHRPDGFPVPEGVRKRSGLAIGQAEELGLVRDFDTRIRDVYFDSAGYGGWLPAIRSALETLGADRTCFATDFPYEMNDPKYVSRHIQEVGALDIPKEDKDKFFGETLRELFKI